MASKLHIVYRDGATNILTVDKVSFEQNCLFYQIKDSAHAVPWQHIREVTSTEVKPS